MALKLTITDTISNSINIEITIYRFPPIAGMAMPALSENQAKVDLFDFLLIYIKFLFNCCEECKRSLRFCLCLLLTVFTCCRL